MLTALQIDRAKPAKKAYRLFDSLGLYIEIDPNGGKYWRLKYRFLGKEHRLARHYQTRVCLVYLRFSICYGVFRPTTRIPSY